MLGLGKEAGRMGMSVCHIRKMGKKSGQREDEGGSFRYF